MLKAAGLKNSASLCLVHSMSETSLASHECPLSLCLCCHLPRSTGLRTAPKAMWPRDPKADLAACGFRPTMNSSAGEDHDPYKSIEQATFDHP